MNPLSSNSFKEPIVKEVLGVGGSSLGMIGNAQDGPDVVFRNIRDLGKYPAKRLISFVDHRRIVGR